jgi:hypothetical protein
MPGMKCPACGADSFARNMGTQSLVYRELYYHCRAEECGHVFLVCMEALRTIRPSQVENPMHRLPPTTWRAVANDRNANDDSPPDKPEAAALTRQTPT